jgi:hypothetical protein
MLDASERGKPNQPDVKKTRPEEVGRDKIITEQNATMIAHTARGDTRILPRAHLFKSSARAL